MANRKEKEALSLGLGDAVIVATTITQKRKELAREFRVSPLKGVLSQATIQKRKAKDAAAIQAAHDKAYNPRIKGLAGVPGLDTADDGTIGLAELREQRPDVFDLKPQPKPSRGGVDRMKQLNEKMTARGRKDRYGHTLD